LGGRTSELRPINWRWTVAGGCRITSHHIKTTPPRRSRCTPLGVDSEHPGRRSPLHEAGAPRAPCDTLGLIPELARRARQTIIPSNRIQGNNCRMVPPFGASIPTEEGIFRGPPIIYKWKGTSTCKGIGSRSQIKKTLNTQDVGYYAMQRPEPV